MDLKKAQSRIIYSFLKPVVALASKFSIPMRHLSELLRLSYFEYLRSEGLSQKEIGVRLAQSERHMRLLSSKLKTDFFSPEKEIGTTRRIEDLLSKKSMPYKMIKTELQDVDKADLDKSLNILISEDRIELKKDLYYLTKKYSVLSSETFNNRIDALNHYLSGSLNAIEQRLILDEKEIAKVKTISFKANPEELTNKLNEIEAFIRIKISELEESVEFHSDSETEKNSRFTITFTSAKLN